LEQGRTIWDALSTTERDQIEKDPVGRQMLIHSRAQAERAYRSGRFLYAADVMRQWQLLLTARRESDRIGENSKFTARVEAIQAGDLDGVLKIFDDKVAEITGQIPSMDALLEANRRTLIPSTAQLAAALPQIQGILGINVQIELTIRRACSGLNAADVTDARRNEMIQSICQWKALQVLIAQYAVEYAKSWSPDVKAVAETLPPKNLAHEPAAVERLFHSSYLAAHNTFQNDVVGVLADVSDLSHTGALANMMLADDSLAVYWPTTELRASLHAAAGKTAPSSLDVVFSTHIHAESLAMVSGLIGRWSILETVLSEEGALRYQRTDLLNYLLTSARAAALENIARCKRCEIECVQALLYFETAELTRDDPGEDKVEVLTNYWNASLQAKVLLMLFAGSQT
jgi:hypothetical protein